MNKKSIIVYLIFIFFIVLFQSCKKNETNPGNYLDKPSSNFSFIPKAHDLQVVGVYPSWNLNEMPLNSVPWDKLTRIVYPFAVPNTDGTINTSYLVNISQLVDSAHMHGVEVYFSIGGANGQGRC